MLKGKCIPIFYFEDFKKPKGPRKSKAIGINGRFNGRFESMFHKADNIPETSFTCFSQQFPGLYADPEADCQVKATRLTNYHVDI